LKPALVAGSGKLETFELQRRLVSWIGNPALLKFETSFELREVLSVNL